VERYCEAVSLLDQIDVDSDPRLGPFPNLFKRILSTYTCAWSSLGGLVVVDDCVSGSTLDDATGDSVVDGPSATTCGSGSEATKVDEGVNVESLVLGLSVVIAEAGAADWMAVFGGRGI
jgi:hypothetical protein